MLMAAALGRAAAQSAPGTDLQRRQRPLAVQGRPQSGLVEFVGAAFRRPVGARQRRHVSAERSVGARRKPAFALTLPQPTRVAADSLGPSYSWSHRHTDPGTTDHAVRTRVG